MRKEVGWIARRQSEKRGKGIEGERESEKSERVRVRVRSSACACACASLRANAGGKERRAQRASERGGGWAGKNVRDLTLLLPI